jgi:hypothetical protein
MSLRFGFALSVAIVLVGGCAPRADDGAPANGEATYHAKPQKPYQSDRYSSTRLVLKRTDAGFEVLSSTPSFGGITRPNVEESLPEILEGKLRLYQYTVRSDDGTGLGEGYFLVSQVARATLRDEDDPESIHHVETDDPSGVVRVAIPVVQGPATIEIRALKAEQERPVAEWSKEDAGSLRVDTAPAPPSAQEPPR